MQWNESCSKCGTQLEADEADVGVGIIYGPAGCPGCFWMEPTLEEGMWKEDGKSGEGAAVRMTVAGRTCAECRHVSTDKQKKVLEATGFGDQIMFADESEDEVVYSCRAPEGSPHAGTTFGTTPLTCGAWSAASGGVVSGGDRLTELDRLIAQREARGKGREE